MVGATTGAVMVIERALVAVDPSVSVTSTVKSAVPAAEGLPEMVPVWALRLRPAGSAPPEIDHA